MSISLPVLTQKIYNELSMTGLFSFEFLDEKRKSITEIFFMQPPSGKTLEEVSRSSTIPTLSSNYNLDAGNGTKTLSLSGDLWFISVGSPDNPIARFPNDLENKIDGLNEFFLLRWMLIRYKDYTMTEKGKCLIPTSTMSLSPGLKALYKKVESNLSDKLGALSDKIELVFHDYDMDDHYYTRISDFSASMQAPDFLTVKYNISGECYERYDQSSSVTTEIRRADNEEANHISIQIDNVDLGLEDVEATLGYNSPLFNAAINLDTTLGELTDANTKLQSADESIFESIPEIIAKGIDECNSILQDLIDFYVPESDMEDFLSGDKTLIDFMSIEMVNFYNSTQKIKLLFEGFQGIINSIPREEDIVFYENSDNYTLTEEQFDTENEKKIQNTSNYLFHVLRQGETFKSLAVLYFNDAEKFIDILSANNLTQNDIIDENIIGQIIKIPLNTSSTTRSQENLVFDGNLTSESIQTFLHGRDLFLVDKKLVLSALEDFRMVEGVQNTLESLNRRMLTKKASLNSYSTNFGLINVDEGNAPFLVKIQKFLTDVVDQFQSDSRVESVEMDLDSLKLEGERIKVTNIINLIGVEDSREVQVE